mgnify:CR=1 FL=1
MAAHFSKFPRINSSGFFVKEDSTDFPSKDQLDAIRSAATKATLAGPSKEAQALMSSRTKALLGDDKLRAGREAQQKVASMMNPPSSPSSTGALPQGPRPSAQAPTLSTPVGALPQGPRPSTQAPRPPAATGLPPQGPRPSTQAPRPPAAPHPSQSQIDLYNQAYQNRNNPLARRIIRNKFNTFTPAQKKEFFDYANSRGQGNDWGFLQGLH